MVEPAASSAGAPRHCSTARAMSDTMHSSVTTNTGTATASKMSMIGCGFRGMVGGRFADSSASSPRDREQRSPSSRPHDYSAGADRQRCQL